MAKKSIKQTSVEFPESKINEIIIGLFDFLHEKPENIFVKDYLILECKLLFSDIEILKEYHENFRVQYRNALQVEETKLKKYAAADKLNATFVKEIINRDHNL